MLAMSRADCARVGQCNIIIKCMCSRCRRDDIHVCFAYASPQRMPHMYNHKRVSLKYIK